MYVRHGRSILITLDLLLLLQKGTYYVTGVSNNSTFHTHSNQMISTNTFNMSNREHSDIYMYVHMYTVRSVAAELYTEFTQWNSRPTSQVNTTITFTLVVHYEMIC